MINVVNLLQGKGLIKKHYKDAISIIKKYKLFFLTYGKSYNPKMNPIKTSFEPYQEYLQSAFIF